MYSYLKHYEPSRKSWDNQLLRFLVAGFDYLAPDLSY